MTDSDFDGDFVHIASAAVAKGASVVTAEDCYRLLMPVESAQAHVVFNEQSHPVDRSQMVIAPPRRRVELQSPSSTLATVFIVKFSPRLFSQVEARYGHLGVSTTDFTAWWSQPMALPRTVWVHEIVHRYAFERLALGEHQNDATRFLEVEILKEVFFMLRDRQEGVSRTHTLHEISTSVQAAISHMEAHLFEWCTMTALANAVGTSERSLQRAFRKEVGTTPAAYWRRLKLDAALSLLRSGHLSVGEIAERVGYDNPTAFGQAFRARFGRPPSAFKPKAVAIKPNP